MTCFTLPANNLARTLPESAGQAAGLARPPEGTAARWRGYALV